MVARLDTRQAEAQRDHDAAGVAGARSAEAQTATAIDYQRATLEGDVAARRADVQAAAAFVDQLRAGTRPQEKRQAEGAVEDARSQAEQAEADWERAQALYANDDISRAQRDQAEARHKSAQALLRQAREKLALALEGPREEEVRQAEAQLARARAALDVAEASRLELRRKEQELEGRRAEVARARAQADLSESRLEDAEIRSPIDGYVLSKSAEPGEVLAAGSVVVSIGDLDRPWVRGYIGEADLGKVKLGQKVRLSTDSYPGKSYWGRVSFIASEAEFTPKQIQTPEERVKLVYRVKVEVDNPGHELKSNMPVDAEIQIGRWMGQ
ncbi:MAG: efflux RND transporter periplasmic adaptor subunit [Acidobacteriota bacterium]|nr:efflux RND transporter periplasmic adaptor subunit [Acidobacteriota bacterium]